MAKFSFLTGQSECVPKNKIVVTIPDACYFINQEIAFPQIFFKTVPFCSLKENFINGLSWNKNIYEVTYWPMD